MADVDGLTLMMAIQAVDQEIKRHQLLLTSETLRDREEIQALVSSYEKAADRLREAYEAEWTVGNNLPAYAKLTRTWEGTRLDPISAAEHRPGDFEVPSLLSCCQRLPR